MLTTRQWGGCRDSRRVVCRHSRCRTSIRSYLRTRTRRWTRMGLRSRVVRLLSSILIYHPHRVYVSAHTDSDRAVPAWKAMWGRECVSSVVEVTLQARAPKYSLILELDRKIRDTQLPGYTESRPKEGASLGETMKHFMPVNYRELSASCVSLLPYFSSLFSLRGNKELTYRLERAQPSSTSTAASSHKRSRTTRRTRCGASTRRASSRGIGARVG